MSFYDTYKVQIQQTDCSAALHNVLQLLRPNAAFMIGGVDDLVWCDKEQTKPTDKEIADMTAAIIAEQPMFAIRKRRDKLLAESDYAMIPDRPMSDAKRQAFRDYRAALRSLPSDILQHNVEIDVANLDMYFPIKP